MIRGDDRVSDEFGVYMASHEATEAAFRVKERSGTQEAYDAWWAALETEATLWAALPTAYQWNEQT